MGVYSIKDLENFTQIKAHTLRIWEQRYNLLSPQRTDTNIRLYSDKDLKKILNINLLYTNGLKISKIAKLQENEILELANEILLTPTNCPVSAVEQFINRIVRYDEFGIREDLDKALTQNSLEHIFSNLLVPVLTKIGELWQVDAISAAHEHFFSNILRDFIIRNTDLPENGGENQKTMLLFLREDEYHELGLLFYNYYLRKQGYRTIYLGQALPDSDLAQVVRELKPDYIFTSLIAKMDELEFNQFFGNLSAFFDLNKLYVGGYQLHIHKNHIPKNVHIIHAADNIVLAD